MDNDYPTYRADLFIIVEHSYFSFTVSFPHPPFHLIYCNLLSPTQAQIPKEAKHFDFQKNYH